MTPNIIKNSFLINHSIWDASDVPGAQKWVTQQQTKKRMVYLDSSEPIHFVLFSTDIPSKKKLELLIKRNFRGFKARPAILKEITDVDQISHNLFTPEQIEKSSASDSKKEVTILSYKKMGKNRITKLSNGLKVETRFNTHTHKYDTSIFDKYDHEIRNPFIDKMIEVSDALETSRAVHMEWVEAAKTIHNLGYTESSMKLLVHKGAIYKLSTTTILSDKKSGKANRVTKLSNGFTVETWWDGTSKNFITQIKDTKGHEVENPDTMETSSYTGNAQDAADEHNDWLSSAKSMS